MSTQKTTLFAWIRALSAKLKRAHHERLLESADVHNQDITIYY